MSGWSIALQGGSILLREGLEALLVVAALAAFLRRAGEGARVPMLYAGVIAAIVASLVAAWIFETWFGGAHDDRVEGVVMLVAAALMFYVSGWLLLRQDPRRWQAGLNEAAGRAIAAGSAFSFAVLAFLAVFREGAETVLFLHALAKTSGGWSAGLLGGLAGAAGLLVLLFVVIEWLALRLPLKPVFLFTSAFLFLMGLKFIGSAVQEFQEQTIVDVHPADVPQWAIEAGLNPSWEAIGLQLAIVAVAAVGLAVAMLRQRIHRTAVVSG
jgi:high-affinity iron transporter